MDPKLLFPERVTALVVTLTQTWTQTQTWTWTRTDPMVSVAAAAWTRRETYLAVWLAPASQHLCFRRRRRKVGKAKVMSAHRTKI